MAKTVVINGVTYTDVPEVHIPAPGGLDAVFYDVDEGNALPSEVVAGKTFLNSNGVNTGTMTNIGAQMSTIRSIAESVVINQGYHNGSGRVTLDATEAAKIISGNIKYGVSILGVAGSSTVVDTAISSDAANGSLIRYGYKAYVNGSLVIGTATVPTVSQDDSTKILTIS